MESPEVSVRTSYIQHLHQQLGDQRALSISPSVGVILSSWRGFCEKDLKKQRVGSRWASMQLTKCMINTCNNLVTYVYTQHRQLQLRKEILEPSLTPTAQWAAAARKTQTLSITSTGTNNTAQGIILPHYTAMGLPQPLVLCAVLVSTAQGGCNVIGEAQKREQKCLHWGLQNH